LIGKEIAELRKNGTVIYQDVAVPCFAFLGDTTCEVLEKNPILFDYPVIIIECTFLLDDHQGKFVYYNPLNYLNEKYVQICNHYTALRAILN
jgi:hypothetical protein